jgi:DNA-binding transcriptional MocR family regulator
MASDPAQHIAGGSAEAIASSVEDAVASGAVRPGAAMPSVRALAGALGVSPSTVAAAYRELRTRGVVVTRDRSRTVVAHRPPVLARPDVAVPPGVRNLADGNPDPALLPDIAAVLPTLAPPTRLYGAPPVLPALADRARTALAADGIDATHLAVCSGALDGIERVLGTTTRAGDRVAVEDPGYAGVLDLVRAMGLQPVGVAVDDHGMDPDALASVVGGCAAAIVTVRAQNPTGAAVSADRVDALAAVLDDHPDVVVIDDDHAADIAGAPARTLSAGRARWAVVRSLAKSLGPDLRVAVVVGDRRTITRVGGRLGVGPGWVSELLQRLAVALWHTADAGGVLATAADTYTVRRGALRAALAHHGIAARGASGLNVWVPLVGESPVVRGLLDRGWAVQPGEAYRLRAGPGIRVTTAALEAGDATRFADDLADVLTAGFAVRRG